MNKVIFVFCLLTNGANAQSYGDQFLPLIFKGFQEQSLRYNTFLRYKDSVLIEKNRNGAIEITNKSTLSSAYVDSLSQNINYNYFFDDTMLHLGKRVLLIDTFHFFSVGLYNFNHTAIQVVRTLKVGNNELFSMDTIKLKSIRSYRNRLILSIQHFKSVYELDLGFDLVANLPPRLAAVFRSYPLYKW
jgi:hypothetical protein